MRLTQSLFSSKAPVEGKWIAIMDYDRADRALMLDSFRTRCLRNGDIHEFLLCPEDSEPNEPIDRIAYLGFGEIRSGGVVEVGDTLYRGDQSLGIVLGFNETHAPNHFNVVFRSQNVVTGRALGLYLAEMFVIRAATPASDLSRERHEEVENHP